MTTIHEKEEKELDPNAQLEKQTFLTASRLKADDSISVPGKIRHGSMTRRSVWHSAAMPVGQAMKIQPVAADIYADDAAM